MSLQIGNDNIKEIYCGSDKIKEVYYGSELVWSGAEPSYEKPSYMILTNGTRIDFEIDNTPIENLCAFSPAMVINGVSYTKTTIKEIHLESSYNSVTEIGTYFLYTCSALTDVTLDLPALNSVGSTFLGGCSALVNVTLTAESPPIAASVGFLNNTRRLTSIYVPFNSVNSYKNTLPWRSHSSLIKPIRLVIG